MIDLLVFPNEVQKIPGQPYNGFSVTYLHIYKFAWVGSSSNLSPPLGGVPTADAHWRTSFSIILSKSQEYFNEHSLLPCNTDFDPNNVLSGSFNNYFPFEQNIERISLKDYIYIYIYFNPLL